MKRGADPVRRLRAGSVANGLGTVVFVVGNFLAVAAITRYENLRVAGGLFVLLAAYLVLITILQCGVPVGLARCLPQVAAGRSGGADAGPLIVAAVAPPLAATVAAAAGAYWFAGEIASGFVGSADQRVWAPVVRVLAVFLIPAVTSAAILAISQGVGEMTPAVVVDRIGSTVLRLVGIVLVARSSGSPRELALAWCVPSVVSMIAATAWTAARMRRWGLVFRASIPAAWRVAGEFWSFTWARALGSVCQIALIWSDVLLVGVIRGPSDAAVYTAVSRLAYAGTTLSAGVVLALQPELGFRFADGDVGGAGTMYRVATRWSLIAAGPVFLLMAAFPGAALSLFGAGYGSGRLALALVASAMIINVATGPAMAVLNMAGRSSLALVDALIAVVLNVCMNLMLIPAYGLTGAAVAWVVTIAVGNVLPVVQVRRRWQISPLHLAESKRLGVIGAVGALTCAGGRLAAGDSVAPLVVTGGLIAMLGAAWLRLDVTSARSGAVRHRPPSDEPRADRRPPAPVPRQELTP